MFDLKRPCVSCPFRKGMGSKFQLRRLKEIREATAFQCHSTVDYSASDDDDDDDVVSKKGGAQQCAGLMALLHRENQPNQMMRIAERIGILDCAALDPEKEVYETWRDALCAHEGREPL